MAATGVLPFIRGVDLSGNDFKVRTLIQCSIPLCFCEKLVGDIHLKFF